MTDLVEFLRARLDEDEQAAQRNSNGKGLADGFPDYRTHVDKDTEAADAFIRQFSPARVLREVEAKRGMLAYHDRAWPHDDDPCTVQRLLVLPYADHPDYREEWRP